MKKVYNKDCVCKLCDKKFVSCRNNTRFCSKMCCDRQYVLSHQKEIKQYRIANKERIKRRRAEHYKNNLETERLGCKKWYSRHRESEIEKNKEYRTQNRELFDWYHNKDRFGGMRDIILNRDENKCRGCGSTNRLSIHHKDGSGYHLTKKTGIISNNDIGNLITLCSSCHTKLHRWQRRNNTILLQDEDIVRTCRKLQEVGGKNQR